MINKKYNMLLFNIKNSKRFTLQNYSKFLNCTTLE